MRLILFFILVFGCLANVDASAVQKLGKVPADTIKKKSAVIIKDSSIVEVRKFNEDSITTYSKQKEFIYDDVPPAKANWWDRFWRWLWNKINHLNGAKAGPILKYGIIILVIGIVTFVIIKFIGVDLKILTGKSKKVTVPYEETLENIHEIDFDEQLEVALANGNYRLGARLLYLKTLKNLSDKELIFWQPEKTNQAYVLELENENYQKEFGELTNQFEYIWYGEFHIDKQTFEYINQSFSRFNQQKT